MSITDTPTLTLANKLRQAADWIDGHDWPAGVEITVGSGPMTVGVYIATLDAETFAAARRVVGIPMTKRTRPGGGLSLAADVTDSLNVTIDAPTDVCKRVQVGTREVPVYETTCPESVLRLTDEVSA